jgi:putative MFS transporter
MLYGPVGMYAVVLVMTIIVFIDVAILGPRASQITLENLSK